MLIMVLLLVAAAAAVAGVALVRNRRAHAIAVADEPQPEPEDRQAGLMYGLIGPPGPEYAPQPMFASHVAAATYAPHRPVVTSAAGTRLTARRGAHRRGTDAKEIARLEALHQAGTLSQVELASLKSRLA